jgi:hypothetical protein
VECGSSTPWIEAKHGDAVANDGVLFSRRKIMITYDTTPTPEFLEAYRRVTGSDDVSPAAVFGAIFDDATAFKISRDEIMRAKAAPTSI